jgi:hypothetical protein
MTSHEPHKPRCATGDDSEPRSELADLVDAMLGRRVRDLRIEVRDGGLVLHGRANSYHAKQLAQRAVMTVMDLPLLANEIVVTYFRGESPRPGGEDALAPEPTPHRAEPVPHTTRATPTADPDDTAPGDDRVAGQSP